MTNALPKNKFLENLIYQSQQNPSPELIKLQDLVETLKNHIYKKSTPPKQIYRLDEKNAYLGEANFEEFEKSRPQIKQELEEFKHTNKEIVMEYKTKEKIMGPVGF